MRRPGPGLITVTLVWFMVLVRSVVAMVSFSFRTTVAMVAILIFSGRLRVMWLRPKMNLEIGKYMTPGFTTNIKVALLTGILQPEKIFEKVGKFQIGDGHRG